MAKVAFKQCDIERTLKAVQKAGARVSVRIDAKTGDICLDPVDAAPSKPLSALEAWEADNAERAHEGT